MSQHVRSAIFQRGSGALSRTLPDASPGYMCPECLLVFPPSSLDGNGLTLEHAPPEAIGGRVVCLTCRECNNRSGSNLDPHMVAAEQLLDFARGRDVELRARFRMSGVEQRGRISMASGTMAWEGVPKAGARTVTDRAIAAMNELVALGDDADGTKFQIVFERAIDERRMRIGWMRSAYLVAFGLLGYRYILQPSLHPLRAQLAIPQNHGFTAPIDIDLEAPEDRRMLYLVDPPDDESGLHVCVGQRRIWLPHIDDADYLERVDNVRHVRTSRRDVTARSIEWPKTASFVLDRSSGGPGRQES